MKYALLIYGSQDAGEPARRCDPASRPSSSGRASPAGLAFRASGLRRRSARPGPRLLIDGPFVDSKEYLAGLVIVDADDLDGALAIADELQELRPGVAIEVRPILERPSGGRRRLPRAVGPRAGDARRAPRRHRAGRGRRPGGVRDRRRALATRRRAGESDRLADRDRAQPRDRSHPAPADARAEDRAARARARRRPAGGGNDRDDARSPTSASS